MRRAALLLPLLLVAESASAQGRFEDYQGIALASGDWRYVATPGGSEATFGAVLRLRCDRATRTVSISRVGAFSGASPMTIATDSGTRTLAAGAALSAHDRWLDSLAFSRGRIILWSGVPSAVMAIPAWPDAARSIEDCRV